MSWLCWFGHKPVVEKIAYDPARKFKDYEPCLGYREYTKAVVLKLVSCARCRLMWGEIVAKDYYSRHDYHLLREANNNFGWRDP